LNELIITVDNQDVSLSSEIEFKVKAHAGCGVEIPFWFQFQIKIVVSFNELQFPSQSSEESTAASVKPNCFYKVIFKLKALEHKFVALVSPLDAEPVHSVKLHQDSHLL